MSESETIARLYAQGCLSMISVQACSESEIFIPRLGGMPLTTSER